MSNEFDHLDHVTNSLIDAGLVKKNSSQVYRHKFFDGSTITWNIDRMKAAVAVLPFSARVPVVISIGGVIQMVQTIESMKHIDKEYALSIPEGKSRLPIYLIEVVAPDGQACSIVVDGNHRLYRAFSDRRGISAIVVPPAVEKACRLPDPSRSHP